MIDMAALIKRTADKCGFIREYFVEDDIPTLTSNVVFFPFFGTIPSCAILSQLLLRRYKELHPDKYLIFISWPGMRHLFPFVDEYWSPRDTAVLQGLAIESDDFRNESVYFTEFNRSLNNYFENVISYNDIKPFYDYGITPKFWEVFKKTKVFLPSLLSHTNLPLDLQSEFSNCSGKKIVIYPCKRMRSWQSGKCVQLPVHLDFWNTLVERLIREGYKPVVYQNWFTYNLSAQFASQCIWLTTKNISQVLSGMRSSDCLLDIHSGISRLAVPARCPALIVDERQRYVSHKEYELDDLEPFKIPRQYFYSFSTRLMTGNVTDWNLSLLDGLVTRLQKLQPLSDGFSGEYYDEIDYSKVRQRKNKRLGVRFIKKRVKDT